ncbi:hypothetical protein [Arthrobacter sp. zg-Y1110]|uniref:hypothetical protein n=1 Tax=Arthrobacter sp. zg-Y1110 TaxID=2886932 RepID=UPI001D159E3E|nr:hypothetical protein [Arthrobacter sp. zg-Y1110]MCC3290825.1 hypothetical protein [Arthrobacter sp. zg-Y1110]UWX86241.1 hypothetical protein N2K99_06920 [Arthrobacter sp. zg-Y1110]
MLTPVARSFSLRILLGIIGLAGISPFLWWIKADVLFTDRGTILLALAAGALCGSAGAGAVRGLSLRRLLPEFRSMDALPILAGAASTWVVHNYLLSRSLDSTLFLLTRSWDFAPHFNMFNMIRNHGSVIAVLPPAFDGSAWTASAYPQGYHALLASLAEISMGNEAMDVAGEATLFLKLVGVSSILGTVLVVSALTALPVFRRRLAVTAPLTALACAAWVVGPGGIPVFNAFPNFGLAVALSIAAIALVHLRTLLHPLVSSAALVLAVVGVAHGWILLLVLCLPAVIVYAAYLLSHRRDWRWPELTGQVLIIGIGLAGVLAAAWQLRKMSAGEVLNTDGGMHETDPGLTLIFVFATAAVVWALAASRGTRSRTMQRHSAWLLATPLYAAVLLIALAVFQLTSADEITYYFHKSMLAVELVAVVCAVIGAGELLLPRIRAMADRRTVTAASVLATLCATHFFGAPYTGLDEKGLKASAFGSEVAVNQDKSLSGPLPKPIEKLEAMAVPGRQPFIYVGHDVGTDPLLMAQWSLTLQGIWSEGVQPAIPMLKPLYKGPNQVPNAVEPILESSMDLDVVVDPELVAPLQEWLPEHAHRITTWKQ